MLPGLEPRAIKLRVSLRFLLAHQLAALLKVIVFHGMCIARLRNVLPLRWLVNL
jgi:hypothetical protein